MILSLSNLPEFFRNYLRNSFTAIFVVMEDFDWDSIEDTSEISYKHKVDRLIYKYEMDSQTFYLFEESTCQKQTWSGPFATYEEAKKFAEKSIDKHYYNAFCGTIRFVDDTNYEVAHRYLYSI